MRAFIDMDGVLVDLLPAWLKLKGLKMPNPWPDGVYDLKKIFSIEDHNIWDGCDEKWWAELPPTPDAAEIVKTVEGYVGLIYLITNPIVIAGASGKIQWISKNFPRFAMRWMMGPCRTTLANDETILIDDESKNIDSFNQSGGRGITLARKWNNRFAQSASTVPDLNRRLGNCISAYAVGAREISTKPWID